MEESSWKKPNCSKFISLAEQIADLIKLIAERDIKAVEDMKRIIEVKAKLEQETKNELG